MKFLSLLGVLHGPIYRGRFNCSALARFEDINEAKKMFVKALAMQDALDVICQEYIGQSLLASFSDNEYKGNAKQRKRLSYLPTEAAKLAELAIGFATGDVVETAVTEAVNPAIEAVVGEQLSEVRLSGTVTR